MAHRLLLGLALRAEMLPPPPPSQSEQRQGCYGKWYCIAGSVPSASTALSRRVCRPEPKAPRGRGSSWAGPVCRSNSFLPLRPQNQRVSQGAEGRPCPPPMFLSVNNQH